MHTSLVQKQPRGILIETNRRCNVLNSRETVGAFLRPGRSSMSGLAV